VATAPQFCGLEIVKAIPDRRQRGIQKAGEHRGTRRADPRLLESVRRICETRQFETLDWLYRGDRSRLPRHLTIEIARIEIVEPNINH
jgi:hypothetical protein